MIKPEAIVAGRTVVFDPSSLLPLTRRYFLITEEFGEGWKAVNVTTRSSKRFTHGDLKRLIPTRDTVHCDLDLTALLGRKVSVELTFGNTVGVCTEVQTRSVKLLDVDVEVPVGIAVDGEMLRYSEVRSVNLAP